MFVCEKLLNLLTSSHCFDLLLLVIQDIFKQATEDRLTSANELPYFEGDFWPNVLEESIKELEQEEEERKKEENTASCETPEVREHDLGLGGGRKGFMRAKVSFCQNQHTDSRSSYFIPQCIILKHPKAFNTCSDIFAIALFEMLLSVQVVTLHVLIHVRLLQREPTLTARMPKRRTTRRPTKIRAVSVEPTRKSLGCRM